MRNCLVVLLVFLSFCFQTFADVQVWDSGFIDVSKMAFANDTLEANQDRITSNVWITRGARKSIYNAAVETKDSTGDSPSGTLWAKGKISEYENLIYEPFKKMHGSNPSSLIDEEVVLFLVEDSIYIAITIKSWGSGPSGGGSFEYSRATKQRTTSSIADITLSFTFAFPNPCSDAITIQHSSPIESIKLIDLMGKTVLRKEFSSYENTQQVGLLELEKGIYWIIINDKKRIKVTKL